MKWIASDEKSDFRLSISEGWADKYAKYFGMINRTDLRMVLILLFAPEEAMLPSGSNASDDCILSRNHGLGQILGSRSRLSRAECLNQNYVHAKVLPSGNVHVYLIAGFDRPSTVPPTRRPWTPKTWLRPGAPTRITLPAQPERPGPCQLDVLATEAAADWPRPWPTGIVPAAWGPGPPCLCQCSDLARRRRRAGWSLLGRSAAGSVLTRLALEAGPESPWLGAGQVQCHRDDPPAPRRTRRRGRAAA